MTTVLCREMEKLGELLCECVAKKHIIKKVLYRIIKLITLSLRPNGQQVNNTYQEGL